MNKYEALAVARQELASYRLEEYLELLRLLTQSEEREAVGASGVGYQVQIEALWDHEPNGDLRVLGLVSEGSLWRSIWPLSDDFIMRPDGSFVGE